MMDSQNYGTNHILRQRLPVMKIAECIFRVLTSTHLITNECGKEQFLIES